MKLNDQPGGVGPTLTPEKLKVLSMYTLMVYPDHANAVSFASISPEPLSVLFDS